MYRDQLFNLLVKKDYESIGDLFKTHANEFVSCELFSTSSLFSPLNVDDQSITLINTKLFAYCTSFQDIEFLKELLFVENIEEIFETYEYTNIYMWIEKGGKIILEYLIKNLNWDDLRIEDLLYHFICSNKIELVIVLLHNGFIPNNDDIERALCDNKIDIVKLFLENNYNVQSALDSCIFYDSLNNDISCIDMHMIKLLISYGISLSAQ